MWKRNQFGPDNKHVSWKKDNMERSQAKNLSHAVHSNWLSPDPGLSSQPVSIADRLTSNT
jgi:hypothetical protein